ncbi:putative DNA binding domain-containing protein [Bacteroidales bacterium OttesenSCG-928-B11]|nr:putative DNA binding domain-containing protein [Bacteroidales bacterium OttesenSCG-928-C03]MDL2311638.1 putative DNA binding domain-containing protein [Bacteroidales bacterium OttesenSCG-928-B11]MDL2326510.1 putative DNA binding domain-containing protein [Bacteroidales bacterium OttesenSCG-928-A14]
MENSFIIENLLQQKSSIRLEFKAQPNMDAIAKSITSFINTQGGDLVVGVDNDGKILGVENAQQQAIAIQNALVELIKPTAPISVQVINYKKNDVILISVWEGAKKPYHYKGVIYNRKGQATTITNHKTLDNIILQRKETDFHWERMPLLGAELADLDTFEIEQTIKSYKEYKKDANFVDVEDFLIQVGLIQNGNITNACMVLFGKNPVRFIPQCKIRLTLYPSKTSGNQFIDDKVFDGNIFRNIIDLSTYLDTVYGKNLSIEGVFRTEKPNYPILAFREGIMNAIVHRDYNSIKGFLQISIYADRTEISNYGALPDGITVADLKVEHNSILRNPDIAQMCFYRKFIEMLGTGTQRMIRDCKVNKFKIPVWKQKENVTTVIFPNVTHNRKTEGITEDVVRGISKKVVAKIEGIIEGITEGVTEDVKDKITKILLVIYKESGVRTVDIEKLTNIPVKSLERYIKQLKDAEIIEFKGANRTGGYYLTKDLENKINSME